MNLLGYILLAMMVAAAAQAIVSALLVFLIVLLICGLLFRTRETVGLLVSMLFLQALSAHPWATISVSLGLGAAVLIARHIAVPKPSAPTECIKLPPPSEPGASPDGT